MLIVTAYDGSDHGNAALARADELSKCLDAEHHVILVAHVQSYQWTAMSNPYQIDLYALEEEHLNETYEKAKTTLSAEPTVVMRRGEPAREIIAYAEEVGADFIVMEASPLDDITNSRRISSVVRAGRAIDRSEGGS